MLDRTLKEKGFEADGESQNKCTRQPAKRKTKKCKVEISGVSRNANMSQRTCFNEVDSPLPAAHLQACNQLLFKPETF